MISRGVSNGAVCLGCRLRLLQAACRPGFIRSPSRIAILNRRQNPRWFASESAAWSDEPPQQTHHVQVERKISAVDELRQEFEDVEPFVVPKLPPQTTEEDLEIEPILDNTIYPPSEHKRPGWKRIDVRKNHKAGKRFLTERSASLGDGTLVLGEQAYAIVMKDGGILRRRKRGKSAENQQQGEAEPAGHVSIGSILESQTQPISHDEVRSGIDTLRPAADISVSHKEFRRIQKKLEEGFLTPQLSLYLEKFKKERKIKAANLARQSETKSQTEDQDQDQDAATQYEWIKDISPWVPLGAIHKSAYDKTSAAGIDRHLYGYTTPDAKPKEQLAVRIMRECWGLHIEELMGGLGETIVKLRNYEFVLLMRGTRRYLRLIIKNFLEPGETIEAFRNKKMLRIITPRTKAETILKEFNDIFKRIETSTFPVALLQKPEMVTEELLEEVGRITNTVVRFSRNRQRIHVTWLQVKSREQFKMSVEDLRHAVFRLLYTAINPPRVERTLHASTDVCRGKAQGRFVVDESDKGKWAWKDKLEQWARYVIPASEPKLPNVTISSASDKKTKKEMENEETETEEAVNGPFKQLEMPFEKDPVTIRVSAPDRRERDWTDYHMTGDEEVTKYPVRWSPTFETITMATFGHVLHSHTHSPPPRLPDLLTAQHPRIFVPVVPHPTHLATLGPSSDDIHPEFPITSHVVIKLSPAPPMGTKAGLPPDLAPPLELRLNMSTDSSSEPTLTGIHSLRALRASHIHDALLPENPIDIRFSQTRYAPLLGSPEAIENWQPVWRFLDNARLDMAKGKLEMPPQQKFFLAVHLLKPFTVHHPSLRAMGAERPFDRSALVDKIKRQVIGDNGMATVTYEFVGLELHRSVTTPHKDPRFSLTYTSIEAGQGGGRRAELSLRPVPYSEFYSGGFKRHDLAKDESSLSTTAAADENAWGNAEDNAGENTGENSGENAAGWALHNDYLNACYDFARTTRFWSGDSR